LKKTEGGFCVSREIGAHRSNWLIDTRAWRRGAAKANEAIVSSAIVDSRLSALNAAVGGQVEHFACDAIAVLGDDDNSRAVIRGW